MKAPHKVGHGGWGPHHHKPGKAPKPPPPHHKAKPPHHKQPPKPKPAPKPQKTHAHKKPRKWSPGSDVACCTAEALGLLLGWGADEVLALYWRTASDLDSGASILDTLTACELPAERFGLRLEECFGPVSFAHDAPVGIRDHVSAGDEDVAQSARWAFPAEFAHPLILGVTLPEPHAVAVTPGGTWWSWGQPFNPYDWPELVVEEAWCLR